MIERATIQQVFIRVCRDSGFTLDIIRAALLASAVLKIHPLQIWHSMDIDTMDQIAGGIHPAAHR